MDSLSKPDMIPPGARVGGSIALVVPFALALAITLVLGLVLGSGVRVLTRNMMSDLESEADRYVDNLAGILALPIWTFDEQHIESIATAFSQNDTVCMLAVVDGYGRSLFALTPQESAAVVRSREVLYEGAVIGRVRLGLSTEAITEERRNLLLLGFTGLLASVLAVFGMTVGIVRFLIKQPLLYVAAGADRVALGERGYRFPRLGPTELQPLAHHFNEMATRIEEREERLERENREHVEAEQRIRFQNIVLSTQGEASPDGILVVDQDQRIISYNSRYQQMWGIPDEVMALRSNVETMRIVGAALEDPEGFRRKVRYLYEHPTEESRDDLRLRDGRVFVRHTAPMVEEDGTYLGRVWFFRDATAQRRAVEALARNEERLRSVVSGAPVVLWMLDRDGVFIFSEGGGLSSIGLRPGEVVGQSVFEIYRDVPEILDATRRALAGETLGILVQVGEVSFETRYAPTLGGSGEIAGLIGVAIDVSERRRAEAALAESEARYRTLFHESPVGLCEVDLSGALQLLRGTQFDPRREPAAALLAEHPTLIDQCAAAANFAGVNAAALRLLGVQHEQDFVTLFRRRAGLGSRELFARDLVAMARGQTVFEQEGEGTADDGRPLFLAYRRIAAQGHESDFSKVLVSVVDLTGARLAEERFRELADNIREVFWVFDWESQSVLYVNPAYETIWARSAARLYEDYTEWAESIHPQDREDAETSFRRLIARPEGLLRRYRIVRPDGAVRWIEDRGIAIRGPDGEVRRVVGVAEDITARHLVEAELARHRDNLHELVEARTRELEEAQKELVRRERLSVLGRLTATVSHELRNPLGVIRSSAFYLERTGRVDAGSRKHLSRIEEQVAICDSIVADLLEYTRGHASERTRSDIRVCIREAIDAVSFSPQVQLEAHVDQEIPLVSLDTQKMRRVFVNLLENAVQAVMARAEDGQTPPGFDPHITVVAGSSAGELAVEVRDNGIGMDKATAERAFEPLFTTRARGTGLGLALVQKIVKEHQGRVSIDSRPETGTTVTVTLPFKTGKRKTSEKDNTG
jgi:PAS domain S-box-containing protein